MGLEAPPLLRPVTWPPRPAGPWSPHRGPPLWRNWRGIPEGCGLGVVNQIGRAGNHPSRQLLLEGRAPGPERCSVPSCLQPAPSTAPDVRLTQPDPCVWASSGLPQHPVFCLLLTFFPFPGNPSHQGLFLHPGADQPTGQLKWLPQDHPEPSLPYTASLQPPGSAGASLPP